jgi:hypothetical protein
LQLETNVRRDDLVQRGRKFAPAGHDGVFSGIDKKKGVVSFQRTEDRGQSNCGAKRR